MLSSVPRRRSRQRMLDQLPGHRQLRMADEEDRKLRRAVDARQAA
jgi:hypothetical protein